MCFIENYMLWEPFSRIKNVLFLWFHRVFRNVGGKGNCWFASPRSKNTVDKLEVELGKNSLYSSRAVRLKKYDVEDNDKKIECSSMCIIWFSFRPHFFWPRVGIKVTPRCEVAGGCWLDFQLLTGWTSGGGGPKTLSKSPPPPEGKSPKGRGGTLWGG